jgi:hypothetical protein
VEVVHVELPYERVHVTVPEVDWKDSFFEVLSVQNFEAQTVDGPPDHGMGLSILANFE